MNGNLTKIEREKHLDHMVKVVPLIVFAYAIQCYFIMKMGPADIAVNGLIFLGASLICLIGAFITYDLTHAVEFHDETLSISVNWLKYYRSIPYNEVAEVVISEPGQSFATVSVITHGGAKYKIHFVDDADKIKKLIEQKKTSSDQVAA